MSKSINLVKYAVDENKKINETETELIETAFVTSSLLDEIIKDNSLINKCVYEQLDSDECYQIECFDDNQVENILKKLKDDFITVLTSDCKKISKNIIEHKSKQSLVTQGEYIKSSEIDDSINRFRTITNVINIFKLKNDKYSDDMSVVLKIG